jgi:Flp pilus assembly protein TadB
LQVQTPSPGILPRAISSAIFNVAVRAPIMFQPTLDQVRRTFRVVSGFTLLLAGVVMIITPGPGWLTIFLGLSLLAAEFVWARRLMNRIKKEGDRFKEAVLGVDSHEEVDSVHASKSESRRQGSKETP